VLQSYLAAQTAVVSLANGTQYEDLWYKPNRPATAKYYHGHIQVPMLYRLSKLITGDATTSLLTAAFLAFSCFHVQMISGIKGMDHNDVALGFYVLASLWTFAEYYQSRKWYWVVLTGVFAGAAILVKWLVGLFVFLCWGILLLIKRQLLQRNELLPLVTALLICDLISIPWQVYILSRWPAEARFEYEFNRRHITEVLQGHKGSVLFYLARFPKYLGYLFPFLLIGLAYSLKKGSKNNSLFRSLLLGMAFVFCFFPFVVKTKVESDFFFIVPLCMLLAVLGMQQFLGWIRAHRWHCTLVLLITITSVQPWFFCNISATMQNGLQNCTIPGSIKT